MTAIQKQQVQIVHQIVPDIQFSFVPFRNSTKDACLEFRSSLIDCDRWRTKIGKQSDIKIR